MIGAIQTFFRMCGFGLLKYKSILNKQTGEFIAIMAKKTNPATEPLVSGGAPLAREKRKHSPARRAAQPVSESITESAPVAAIVETAPVEAEKTLIQEQRPSFEEIAQLAYSYWEARGCQGGSPEEDWLRAERDLSKETVASKA